MQYLNQGTAKAREIASHYHILLCQGRATYEEVEQGISDLELGIGAVDFTQIKRLKDDSQMNNNA